ncbi:RimK family alpha-L-glutamate ligase [Lewinella sp. W8]|uniref:ATP-grasp domain-containing protein n=1 Tax=Lewinella sp. W8 TaxID=2528208 RepID=UPI001067C25E|nr:glutathione synthetase [Lewinella sp. W8]MTB49536.1 glutathione synthetase [Lewinella sp. W8]
MSKRQFLVLTDHRGHSPENSLYALLRTLAGDDRTAGISVASRGDARNATFFAGQPAPLYGLKADTDFAFETTDWSEGKLLADWETFDVVWLRLPPPADPAFFAFLTSMAPAPAEPSIPFHYTPRSPKIINDPTGILETGSKEFLLHFPNFTPAVRRVKTTSEVQAFADERPIVLKPLRDYGGRGLVKISGQEVEWDGETMTLASFLDAARTRIEAGHYLAMEYLSRVTEGDKRILVVNGQILGASLRLPPPGEWLCNVARGGRSVPAEVTPEERDMIAAISPKLKEKGIVIYGADTLMNDDGIRVLSELNTNSIGGFPQAEAQSGRPVLQQTINGIYDFLYE